MNKGIIVAIIAVAAIIAIWAVRPPDAPDEHAQAPTAGKLHGVNLETKTIRIGALNDESGAAAAIGKPFAVGKRILVKAVNSGDSDLLPEGWRLELIERDHGYNPQHSVQAYNELKDRVLFIATSFGTPNTLPLRRNLERDGLMAFPASLSSEMAEHEYTPPLGTPYKNEAMRAMDWAVEHAGGAENVVAGIVYQQDDYGADGVAGWNAAAEHHGVEVVSSQAVAPGQTDYTAVVSALREAGANYILLTTLPSATGPILGTAAQLQFMPVWVGNTPAWIDRFFDSSVIPAAVFTNYYWATSLPYWGEDVEGMDEMITAYEQYGKDMSPQDYYILASYVQGLIQLEALRRAIDSGDLTREGYKNALQSLDNWTAGELMQPVNMSVFPYETGTEVRILKPIMADAGWEVVADYAEPLADSEDNEQAALDE